MIGLHILNKITKIACHPIHGNSIGLIDSASNVSTILVCLPSIKKIVEEALEAERISFKEELKEQKRTVFHLEGELKSFEQERSQLNRQNQSLMDMVDELKARTRRSDQLEEENQKLHLDVQLLRREKETFENRLQEQIELAVLRERNKLSDSK